MFGQPGKFGPAPRFAPCYCPLIEVLRSCPCSNLLADQGVMATAALSANGKGWSSEHGDPLSRDDGATAKAMILWTDGGLTHL